MRNVSVNLVQVAVAKNVPVLLYQLLEFKQLNLDSTPVDKTCTNQLTTVAYARGRSESSDRMFRT